MAQFVSAITYTMYYSSRESIYINYMGLKSMNCIVHNNAMKYNVAKYTTRRSTLLETPTSPKEERR